MKDTCVIISGATGGIGKELSQKCISSNDVQKCILLYKDESKFKDCFSESITNKIHSQYYNMEKDFYVELALLDGKYTNIRLVLNAFTIQPIERIESLDMKDVVKNININILSQINLINSVLKEVKRLNLNLSVINLNSGAAYKPLKAWSLYSGAKAYINMYLKTLLEEENIQVVSYDPGVVNTPMQKVIRDTDINIFEQAEIFRNYHKNNMLNTPQQVAEDIFSKYILDWKALNFEERFSR